MAIRFSPPGDHFAGRFLLGFGIDEPLLELGRSDSFCHWQIIFFSL
jgi:hypothetical protein